MLESLKEIQKKPHTSPKSSPNSAKESKAARYIKELKSTLYDLTLSDQAAPFSQSKCRTKRLEEMKDQKLHCEKKLEKDSQKSLKRGECSKTFTDNIRTHDSDIFEGKEHKKYPCEKKPDSLDVQSSKKKHGECSTTFEIKMMKKKPDSKSFEETEAKGSSRGMKQYSETESLKHEKCSTQIPEIAMKEVKKSLSSERAEECLTKKTEDSGINTMETMNLGDCESKINSPNRSTCSSKHSTRSDTSKNENLQTQIEPSSMEGNPNQCAYLNTNETKVIPPVPNEPDTSLTRPNNPENFEIFYKAPCEKIETKNNEKIEIKSICDKSVTKPAKNLISFPRCGKELKSHSTSPTRKTPVPTPRKCKTPSPRNEVQVIPPNKEIELKIEDMKPEDLITEISEKDGNAIIRITPRQSFENTIQPCETVLKTNPTLHFSQDETQITDNPVNLSVFYPDPEQNNILEQNETLLLETPPVNVDENSPRNEPCSTRKLSPVFEEEAIQFHLDSISERSINEKTSEESYCDPFNKRLVDRITTISQRLSPCLSRENQNISPKILPDSIYDRVAQSETISYFVTATASDMTLKPPEKKLELKTSSDFKFKGKSVQETECMLDALSKQLNQLRNQSQKREYYFLKYVI